MEAWSPEEEAALVENGFEGMEFADLTLEEYARVLCCILGIPVYDRVIESVHLLLTLYSEVMANQHYIAAVVKN